MTEAAQKDRQGDPKPRSAEERTEEASATSAPNGTAEGLRTAESYEATFPLDSFREAARHLRRPFTPAAIKFKVQSTLGDNGALVVSYIDARLVVERLNLIVPHLWDDDYKALDGKHLLCELTVDGITRRDVGEGTGKGLYSDALKRAAVKFGVGVSLYAIPQANLWLSEHGKYIKSRKSGQKTVIDITPEGDSALRRRYENWLDQVGVQKFGPPLDHGDTEEPQGDVDVTEEPESEEEIHQQVEGAQADKKREEARGLYSHYCSHGGSRSDFPPGQFRQGLLSHGDSLERLDEYIDYLRGRVDKLGVAA